MSDLTLIQARRIVKQAEKTEEETLVERTRVAAEKLVGKHFKFWNGGDGENWWLYLRVLAVKSVWKYVATFRAEHIQAAPAFGISVEVNDRPSAHNGELDSAWQPISETEYVRETGKILRKLGLERR